MYNPASSKRKANARIGRSARWNALAFALAAAAMPSAVLAQDVLEVERGATVTLPGDRPSPLTVGQVKVEGTLALRDGAVLTNSGIGEVGVSLPGDSAGALVSEARLSGENTLWNQVGALEVGVAVGPLGSSVQATGKLFVDSGADLVVGGAASFGGGFGGSAQVEVSGAGSSLSAESFRLGNGSLDVLGGGVVAASEDVRLGGYLSTSRGRTYQSAAVRVDGAGSLLSAGGDLRLVEKSALSVGNGASLAADRIVAQGQLAVGGGMTLQGTGVIFDAPSAPGQVDAATVRLEDAGTLTFNHTSSDYVFAARLESGTGDSLQQPGIARVNLIAGTTRLTGDSAAFGGQTWVFGNGRLLVDGALGGLVMVEDRGVLGGSGSVGSVEVASGGILAPGSSIGRLSVAGDLTLRQGSVFQAEVTPQGAADQVAVAGKASIEGGSLMWVSSDSGFRPFTEYTLIDAKGGVSGQFGQVNNDYAFLNVQLAYNPGSVVLQLIRNDVGYADQAETANQRAAATAAESAGSAHPLWNAIAVLTGARAREAFDQLAGETHASTRSALIESAAEVRGGVLTHLRESDAEAGSSLWVQAMGRQGETEDSGNTAEVDRESAGVLFGADLALGDHWRLGGVLGAGRTRTDLDSAVAHSESDDRYFGLYADARWDGPRLRLGAIFSQHEIDVRRRLAALGQSGSLTARYDADGSQFFGEFGYVFEVGEYELEPFLGLAQAKLEADRFQEDGGLGALSVQAEDNSVRYSTLGLRLGTPYDSARRWHFGGLLGWRRASGDIDPVSRAAFDAGTPFVVSGAPIARNAAVVEANFGAQVGERTSFSLGYAGQIASDASDHGASAKLIVRF